MAFPPDVLLRKVAKDEGFDTVEKMLEAAALDSVCPGICKNCTFTCSGVEPDARDAWCENCGKLRVESVLVIAGLI